MLPLAEDDHPAPSGAVPCRARAQVQPSSVLCTLPEPVDVHVPPPRPTRSVDPVHERPPPGTPDTVQFLSTDEVLPLPVVSVLSAE